MRSGVLILAVALLVVLLASGCTETPVCAGVGEISFDGSTGEITPCCDGLNAISGCHLSEDMTCDDYNQMDGCGSICSDCGNGVCDEQLENICNCPDDCTETPAACANKGEHFSAVYTDEYPESCCSGLTEWESGMDTSISIADQCYDTMMVSGWPVGTCINCGNGICESIENVCNCPEDCPDGQNSEYATIDDFCATGWQTFDDACQDDLMDLDLPICDLCS